MAGRCSWHACPERGISIGRFVLWLPDRIESNNSTEQSIERFGFVLCLEAYRRCVLSSLIWMEFRCCGGSDAATAATALNHRPLGDQSVQGTRKDGMVFAVAFFFDRHHGDLGRGSLLLASDGAYPRTGRKIDNLSLSQQPRGVVVGVVPVGCMICVRVLSVGDAAFVFGRGTVVSLVVAGVCSRRRTTAHSKEKGLGGLDLFLSQAGPSLVRWHCFSFGGVFGFVGRHRSLCVGVGLGSSRAVVPWLRPERRRLFVARVRGIQCDGAAPAAAARGHRMSRGTRITGRRSKSTLASDGVVPRPHRVGHRARSRQ